MQSHWDCNANFTLPPNLKLFNKFIAYNYKLETDPYTSSKAWAVNANILKLGGSEANLEIERDCESKNEKNKIIA